MKPLSGIHSLMCSATTPRPMAKASKTPAIYCSPFPPSKNRITAPGTSPKPLRFAKTCTAFALGRLPFQHPPLFRSQSNPIEPKKNNLPKKNRSTRSTNGKHAPLRRHSSNLNFHSERPRALVRIARHFGTGFGTGKTSGSLGKTGFGTLVRLKPPKGGVSNGAYALRPDPTSTHSPIGLEPLLQFWTVDCGLRTRDPTSRFNTFMCMEARHPSAL